MKNDPSQDLVQRAIAASNEVMVIADAQAPDTPLVYVNPAFERVTGYRADEALGRNCRYLHREDRNQDALDAVRIAIADGTSCTALLRNYRKDGTLFWNQLHLAPLLDGRGAVTHFMGTMLDVTERLERERALLEKQRELERSKRALESLALKDGLTQLYNRRHFDEQIAREWNRARRERLPVSLFMIDIDHFKRFNDSFGHRAGDGRIRMVADVLRRCFARGADLVARYGGEEFVALAPGLQAAPALERAQRVCDTVRRATTAHSSSGMPPVTVSIGLVTEMPVDGLEPEQLLEAADRALYEAKRQGRDRTVQCAPLRNADGAAYANAA